MLEPLTDYITVDDELDLSFKGKMGCIILAGGQGTRLGVDQPKGTFPVFNHKSLFEIFFTKAKAASKRAGFALPLAIMTSPKTHQETVNFLEKNHWFGVDASIFQQNELPLLDDEGNPTDKMGPDGNGYVLKLFYESGIYQKWKEQGIECVNVVLVDNALADPFDAKLYRYHRGDVTIKCIARIDPEEKVGVLAKENGKIKVIEYTELPEVNHHFPLANISLFCFSMPFIEKCASITLPYHLQKKNGLMKRETYIFDLLPYADEITVLKYPREDTFAPLKDRESLSKIQKAILDFERKLFFKISGQKIPDGTFFDLDPQFYYPTPDLIEKWRGKSLTSAMIRS